MGCSRKPDDRIAVLPIANLTGDSSLDWISKAGSAIIAEESAGSTIPRITSVATVGDAYVNGATRFLHGYVTRRTSGLHFEFEAEDAVSHRIVQTASSNGSVLFAMSDLARKISTGARPFSTSNPDAIEAWGRGDFERATTIDLDFGTAWRDWIRLTVLSGHRAEAQQIAERALSRASLRSEFDRMDIEGQLAEIYSLDRRFTETATLYKKILEVQPNNAAILNALGYTEAILGQIDDARMTFEKYGKQPGQGTNALDSLGEAYFMNGKFVDAEKLFEQAYNRDPRFLQGVTLSKSAHARWLAGDLKGADEIFQRYLNAVKPPDALWQEAAWLYETGRRDQAISKLGSNPAYQQQVLIWRGQFSMPNDLATLKKLYENVAPAADNVPRMFYAAVLAKTGNKIEARELLKRWPLPEVRIDPLLQPLVFPLFMDLQRELGSSSGKN